MLDLIKTKECKFNSWQLLMGGLVALILILVVLYPLAVLLLYSLGVSVHSFDFSLVKYWDAFSDIKTIISIKNTLYIATGVTLMAGLLGGGLAWLISRTDLPGKRIFRVLIFLAFVIPSYILAVAWIELFGRNGFFNRIMKEWHFIDEPINIYSLEGIIIIMAIHLFPLVFMSLSSALKMSDISLEKASRLAGAGRLRTLLSITVPLIMPSILSIGLLVFQQTMACFGVAAVIGLPSGKYILTTRIYSALNGLDLPMATASSGILLLCSGLVFILHNISLRKKRYIHVNSRSQTPELIPLGRWKIPVVSGVAGILTLTTLIPLGTLIFSSFLKKWGMELSLENFTLINYRAIFMEQATAVRAIRNSICFGAGAASIAAVLGATVVFISNKTRLKSRKAIEFAATWPLAVPGTVMAVAATLAWINPPFKLYATPWIIIITYVAACLPFAVRNVNGLMQEMDPVLENAARISGASRFQSYQDITLPVIMPGIRTGWIMSFLMALREIPISIMLYSVGSETIGVLMFNMRSDSGGLETISALAVLVILLTVIGNVLIEKFGKSRMEGS